MSSKYGPDRVLNPIRRRIFRTRITPAENAVSAALLACLAIAGLWILLQRDRYDPAERDITIEALGEGRIREVAYRAPLVRWREPGAAGPGGAEAAPTGVDLGIFPPAIAAGGWQVDGRVETYDPTTLYEKINGQAEQYLKFGFRQLHFVTLARESTFLNVELYDQGEFQNALGVFASQRDAEREVIRHGAVSFYPTSVGAIGIADRFFFKLTANEAGESVRRKTEEILSLLPGIATGGAGASAPFAILTQQLDVPFEGVAYAKENALQYDFFADVWFGEPAGAGGARVFLHRAPDPQAAERLYARLVEEQKNEHEVVEASGERTLMKHEFLGSYFGVERRQGWLFGVDGAKDPGALKTLLGRIAESVR